MENQDIFIKARELALNLKTSEVQPELDILYSYLLFTNSENLFEHKGEDELSHIFGLSEGGKLFISYLKDKYSDESRCLGIFSKAIQIYHNIDLLSPDFKQFFEGAVVVYTNSFNKSELPKECTPDYFSKV